MTSRAKLSNDRIDVFLDAHPGWEQADDTLARTYEFDSYAAGIAFVVRIGFLAESRDHHPDISLGYRRVRVAWTTHDAGGITALDADLAERTDALRHA